MDSHSGLSRGSTRFGYLSSTAFQISTFECAMAICNQELEFATHLDCCVGGLNKILLNHSLLDFLHIMGMKMQNFHDIVKAVIASWS